MKPYCADPRTKIVVALCLSTAALAVGNIWFVAGVGVLSVVTALMFKVKYILIVKRLKYIFMLFLMLAVIQSIFIADETALIAFGGVRLLSVTGIEMGARTFMRMLAIISAGAIMSTADYRMTVQGLVQWKMPYELAFMTSIAIRFMPIFAGEFRDSVTAVQLRGVDIKKVPFSRRIKLYVYILSPVVTGAMKRAQELAIAMETRAYGAFKKRTSYIQLKMAWQDYAVIFVSVAAAVGFIYASFMI